MNFANPSAFFALAILAVLVWIREIRAGLFHGRLPFPSLTMIKSLPSTWRAQTRRLPDYLIYGGLVFAVVALARPRSLLKGEEAHARGIDIIIALDTSGSMRAIDFNPKDRMTVAKQATKNFIMHRQFDRIGLVAFAGVALLQCPMTLDYAALLEFLEEVEVGITTTENTAIGTAIATASNHLKRSTAKSKVIILVTDGRNNSGEVDPLTAAKAAASLGIKIYTIGVGIRGQSMIPVDTAFGKQLMPIQEDLDEPTLNEIAQATSGRYYRADSTKEFENIFHEIDQLEKSDVQAPSTHEYKDQYLGWLLTGMVLMTLGYGLQMTVWRTVP